MADENLDMDKESQLFPQNDTEGSEGTDDNGKGQEEEQAPGRETAQDEQKPGQESEPESEPKPAQEPQEFDPAALKVPDGMLTDPALVHDFGKLAGEMNLSQAQAQQLVDLQVKTLQAQESQYLQLRNSWVEEIKADSKYGGERLESTLQDAGAVLRRFDPGGEVTKTLKTTGFGDNPGIIRMLADIKRVISDDEFVSSTGKATEKKSLNDRLWPDEVMGEYK